MPNNDREVFDNLTGSDASEIEDFLTYALFAFQRREWVNHYAAINGHPPSDADIDGWIRNISEYEFKQMRTRAVGFFDAAARVYMTEEVEAARQETLQGAVIREVKSAGNIWRQLLIALVTAILAPIIIGIIVVAALRSEDYIPTIRGTKGAAETVQRPPPDKSAPEPGASR